MSEDSTPLIVYTTREIVRLDSGGRGWLWHRYRVPRWFVFFVAGVYIAKGSRWYGKVSV